MTALVAALVVKDGQFERVHPKKQAAFDCKKSNHVTLDLDLITG
jgi:hypothetical protein